MKIMPWREQAKLYAISARGMRYMVSGTLHTLVEIALINQNDLDNLVIETDRGQMFCRYEIAYIGMLADRPPCL